MVWLRNFWAIVSRFFSLSTSEYTRVGQYSRCAELETIEQTLADARFPGAQFRPSPRGPLYSPALQTHFYFSLPRSPCPPSPNPRTRVTLRTYINELRVTVQSDAPADVADFHGKSCTLVSACVFSTGIAETSYGFVTRLLSDASRLSVAIVKLFYLCVACIARVFAIYAQHAYQIRIMTMKNIMRALRICHGFSFLLYIDNDTLRR